MKWITFNGEYFNVERIERVLDAPGGGLVVVMSSKSFFRISKEEKEDFMEKFLEAIAEK